MRRSLGRRPLAAWQKTTLTAVQILSHLVMSSEHAALACNPPRYIWPNHVIAGLGGNQSYRNTESRRLSANSGDPGQAIRKQRLAEYVNNDYAPADKTFGKIIAGSLILVILALLGGVVAYYGVDGLVFAGSGGKYDSVNLTM
mmetsp:Transcript_36637/g.96714  ORF Transcript_36637/g.96714 Transcript_36637/m.96714 type:complete len:143 (+) Transcript_36637:297-725(+)